MGKPALPENQQFYKSGIRTTRMSDSDSDSEFDSESDFEDEEFSFSLKVMIDKEKSKVLFAEADSLFVDMLLSFLTLPLGRIVKALGWESELHAIGSLTTLYRSLDDLYCFHFWTAGAKRTLLNPKSSFEHEYKGLKLDIYDFQPAEFFVSSHTNSKFRSESVYYDVCQNCGFTCFCRMEKKLAIKGFGAASSDGVFTVNTASFIISDDLQILPNKMGLLGIMSILGITETDKAEAIRVTIGLTEILNFFKASLISPTPLSDLILNKTGHTDFVMVETKQETLPDQIDDEESPSSKKMVLKAMIQKSTGKLLYAQAEEDFVEFLFSFLYIPLGGVELLFSGKTCIKAINNLYRSTSEFMHDECFKTPNMKSRLMKPTLPHGCVSKDHILPLAEESLSAHYNDLKLFSSKKFPKGQGSYLKGPQTYKVMDDLTVTPFCIVSTLSSLNKLKIPISDIKEVELQIGLKDGLSILKASLTSTSALTDGLLNHISLTQQMEKVWV